jgi:hypothetical protein
MRLIVDVQTWFTYGDYKTDLRFPWWVALTTTREGISLKVARTGKRR